MVGGDQVSRVAAGESVFVGVILDSGGGSQRCCKLHVNGKQKRNSLFYTPSSFLSTPISPHYLTTGIVSNLSLAITILCAARGENKIL